MMPAAERTSRATASCAATNASVARRRRRPALWRASERRACCRSTREVRTAGASAKTIVATAVMATAPVSAVPFTMDLVEPGKSWWRECDEAPNGAGRDPDAERAAGGGQQRALGQQLRHDPPAARAECRPNRDLPDPGEAAHQEKIGDVDARDQQDQARGGGEGDQRGPHVAQHEPRPDAGDAVLLTRPCVLGSPEECGQLVRRIGGCRAGHESPDHVERHQRQRFRGH